MITSTYRARFVAMLISFVLVLSGLVFTSASAPPAAADLSNEQPAAIRVLNMTPTTVGPEDELRVDIELTNQSMEPLDAVDVTLSIVRYRLSTDSILDNWFTGAEALVAPLKLDSVALEDPLEPGKARKLTLTAPASDLRLLPFSDAAGPRGLIIEATDSRTGAGLDLMRTFLLWYPTDDVEPLRLTILTPVTGPNPTPATPDSWGQNIADLTGNSGRLNSLLQVTAPHREISWVVDPALVQAASSGTAGDSGTQWAQAFTRAATGRDIFALPPYDPDVAALASADITAPNLDTVFSPAKSWRNDLTLPAGDVVDQLTLNAAIEADRAIVLLNQGLLPNTGADPILNAAATVSTAAGRATVLLPSVDLSALFANPSSSGLSSTFETRQLLLARLAIIAQQSPEAAQHVLLTTDRYWDPEVADLDIMVDGIMDARFIETEPLSRLLGARLLEVPAASVPAETEASPTQLTAADLKDVLAQQDRINTLAQAVTDPSALTKKFRTDFAAVTATAWRSDTKGRNQEIAALSGYADELLNAVSIVPGSDLNLISDRGDLPVTVRNDLDQDLQVSVALVPDDQRLSIKEAVPVSIPAQSSQSVNVPATAIGSGDVSVEVQLRAPNGDLISAPSHFNVRVRADWENVGTVVLAVALAIALAFGVIRTIRRGKRPTRMEPIHPPSNPESTS